MLEYSKLDMYVDLISPQMNMQASMLYHRVVGMGSKRGNRPWGRKDAIVVEAECAQYLRPAIRLDDGDVTRRGWRRHDADEKR